MLRESDMHVTEEKLRDLHTSYLQYEAVLYR